MSAFQIAALLVLAFLLVGSVTMVVRRHLARRVGLFWVAVWLAAAAAIIRPDSTRAVAGVLGIGRGADLVLYCFVLAVLIGFYAVYVRLRRLDAALTQLVRHLALQQVLSPERSADSPGPNA
jgi:hypothetical protein